MRVSNQTLERALLQHLSTSLRRVAEAEEKLSTGIRVRVASDDPAAAALVMDIDHQIRNLDQFQRQTGAARIRIVAEDSVLEQTHALLDRARQLAIGGGSDTAAPLGMSASAVEIGHIISQIQQSGNTKVGNEYIFAGYRTDQPPFQNGVYSGDFAVRQLEIDDGVLVDTNHNGDQLFVSSGILQSLADLQTALQSGDPAQVRAASPNLDIAARNLQTLQADIGARMSALDDSDVLRQTLGLDLHTRRADLAEIDFERATVDFLTAQTVLQAARASAGQILQTTLTDFLR